MRKLKSVIPVLAFIVLMAVPVQAANTGAEARFTPKKCWCGGSYENLGYTGWNCKRGCDQPVYNYHHSGFLHSAQAYYCLNGHLN